MKSPSFFSSQQRKITPRRSFLLEPLESRLMMSADDPTEAITTTQEHSPHHHSAGCNNIPFIETTVGPNNSRYDIWADEQEVVLNVLDDDGPWKNYTPINDSFNSDDDLTIIEASMVYDSSRYGEVEVSDDGRSLIYKNGSSSWALIKFIVQDTQGNQAFAKVQTKDVQPYFTSPDTVKIDEHSHGFIKIDVLNNDGVRREDISAKIIEVSSPSFGGHAYIAKHGCSLIYHPSRHFSGAVTLTYKVRFGDGEILSERVSILVNQPFIALEDYYDIEKNSKNNSLNPLANDPVIIGNPSDLHIDHVGPTDAGGTVAISNNGRSIIYNPAVGFTGDETFTYRVVNDKGQWQKASVTVHVAESVNDDWLPGHFTSQRALENYLLSETVKRNKTKFGTRTSRTQWASGQHSYDDQFQLYQTAALTATDSATASYSRTNTQEVGVDEADIIETDGQYIYTISNNKLSIIDVRNTSSPKLISQFSFSSNPSGMYLQDGRLTILISGVHLNAKSSIYVFDISDKEAPSLIKQTEFNGRIRESRSIDNHVFLTINNSFSLPSVEIVKTHLSHHSHFNDQQNEPSNIADHKHPSSYYYRYETVDEFLERMRDKIVSHTLPEYTTYGPNGEVLASGLITEAVNLQNERFGSKMLTVAAFDTSEQGGGFVSSQTIFMGSVFSQIYASKNHFYVAENIFGENASTWIHQFDISEDGQVVSRARGIVQGSIVDQFSIDEHDGYLRIATTFRTRFRVVNDLYVLKPVGRTLKQVGHISDFAQNETIRSVRFFDDHAYVVTFPVRSPDDPDFRDPLFAIDLSTPEAPQILGELIIPGFSNYLHPVSDNFLIGVGRNANEETGQLGSPQISLFDVNDLTNPLLVDRFDIDLNDAGIPWERWSEMFRDHHAISYFPESGILTVPINYRATPRRFNSATSPTANAPESHFANWVFQISTEEYGVAENKIELLNTIYHATGVKRSLRIDETLISMTDHDLKFYELTDPTQQTAELYFGEITTDDTFTFAEDTSNNILDVLSNDKDMSSGERPRITSISDTSGNTVIAADGMSLVYTPDADFFGDVQFSYTVMDPARGEQIGTVHLTIENVYDAPVITIPVKSEPVENEPVESDPVESDPVESEPVENEPVENEPVENEPVENEPVENDPVENDPVENDPVENDPVRTFPISVDPEDDDRQELFPMIGFLQEDYVIANEDHYQVSLGSAGNIFHVLENDENGEERERIASLPLNWNYTEVVTFHYGIREPDLTVVDSLNSISFFPFEFDSPGKYLPGISPLKKHHETHDLTVIEVSQGSAGGTVTINENSTSVSYTPAAGFIGIETFQYTATNGSGTISTTIVTVGVEISETAKTQHARNHHSARAIAPKTTTRNFTLPAKKRTSTTTAVKKIAAVDAAYSDRDSHQSKEVITQTATRSTDRSADLNRARRAHRGDKIGRERTENLEEISMRLRR